MADKMGVEARIEHFLRVSQDPAATQAERDTAGQEAERLLAKHAIDRLTLDVDGARRAEREAIERRTVVIAGGRGTTALDVVLGRLRREGQTDLHVGTIEDRLRELRSEQFQTHIDVTSLSEQQIAEKIAGEVGLKLSPVPSDPLRWLKEALGGRRQP